jgi:hypothetical protein
VARLRVTLAASIAAFGFAVAAAAQTIIIEKLTYPAGGSGFGFTENITLGPFTLDDATTRTFASIAPGSYTVTENDPSGLNFTVGDIDCDDSNSLGDPNTRWGSPVRVGQRLPF